MGLTTAMYTGLSGMNANQTRISNIGHNISNVNTYAFKSSRTIFQTQLSRLLAGGNGPSQTSGGVNPSQIGLGVSVGAIQKNFLPGTIENTGMPSDMAVDGDGFFIVQKGDGTQAYTRDGTFVLDAENKLVSADGHHVRGFAIDGDFNIQEGVLSDITIPLGTLSIAKATDSVTMDGDLSAAGSIATQGSTHKSQAFVNGGGAAAAETTALSDLRSATVPGVPLFADGNTITISGISRGDRSIPDQTFTIGTDGTTLGDFANWLETAMNIQDVDGVPGDPGIVIQNGQLVINSNAGEVNGFTIENTDMLSDNAGTSVPFAFTKTASANGAGVTTSFTVYDSLGAPVVVTATFVKEQTDATGSVWRFYAEAPEADADLRTLGTGTVSFDVEGNYKAATGAQLTIDRSSAGAASPLNFSLDFAGVHGLSTKTSTIIMAEQSGYPPGTLVTYNVDETGVINGVFSNGLTKDLGQVALAVFPNSEGLLAENDNLYVQGPNAGPPAITAAGTLGAGAVIGGALELSNVDLANEFIGLITSSTGFQASSRVISTSSDMLDQLLLIVR